MASSVSGFDKNSGQTDAGARATRFGKKCDIALIGAPVQIGTHMRGCSMGPAMLRTAGLGDLLGDLGYGVQDFGDISIANGDPVASETQARIATMPRWTRAIDAEGYAAAASGKLPIFIGGDHSISMGSINAMARHARDQGRDLMVLWLDAHADYNTPSTSPSGNMHGMPVAALCGEAGLDFIYEGIDRVVLPGDAFHQLGIRSVDQEERDLISRRGVNVMDMRTVDEFGVSRLVRNVIETAKARNAMLHVSFDVDFLDPTIAPAVGTTAAGGANFREAHLIMEMLSEAGCVSSVDIAELNPFLDERGRTAQLMVDLIGSLFGRQIIDRVHAA